MRKHDWAEGAVPVPGVVSRIAGEGAVRARMAISRSSPRRMCGASAACGGMAKTAISLRG